MSDAATVELILTIFLGILTTQLLPWIRRNISQKKIDQSLDIARYAVQAVEYAFKNESSKVKRDQAIAYMDRTGQRFGLNLTDAEWEMLLEKAVYELHVQRQGSTVFKKGVNVS